METTTRIPERRIDSRVRLLRIAGALCAMFAAVGITDGIHQMSPDIGWIVPILAGVIAAAGFAIGWHVMISTVVGMIRLTMIVTLFVVAIVVTMVSLGISAHSIATAIAGRAALATELSARVDGYNQSLAKAFAEATSWGSVATSAGAKAAGYKSQADTEAGGSNGTGKGCGPKCASFRDISAAFSHSQDALNGLLQDAADLRAKGDADMAAMRNAATHADQDGFMAAAEGVSQIIARLNAIDPRPIIVNTGDVVVSKKGIDLSKDTADFQATAANALKDRKVIDAPAFVPLSVGEATRNQMFGTAMLGWIMAGAIDILPLLFLILAFAFSREVWLNEEVIRERVTHEGQDGTDRQRLDSLMGRARTVVPFRAGGQ